MFSARVLGVLGVLDVRGVLEGWRVHAYLLELASSSFLFQVLPF